MSLSASHARVDSLAGRMAVLLAIGMSAAAILSLFIADRARVHDFERLRLEGVVESVTDISRRLTQDPAGTTEQLRRYRIFGAREAPDDWREFRPSPEMGRLLRDRLGSTSRAEAMLMPRGACLPQFDLAIRAAGNVEQALPDCWYVRFRDTHGVDHRLAVDVVAVRRPRGMVVDPIFLCLILATSAGLALFAARIAMAPLRRLMEAARAFSVTIDPEPIPEEGPSEVRAALRTFNLMQHRVRDGFRERTQILASITHDLQTPLTRLRLRLEEVGEETLRNRLISDLAATQKLVRDGLDLARSSESREAWSTVDIDSILSSVAEDAAEFGARVGFVRGCGVEARVKPDALVRCLNNLIENALRYAGDAELSSDIDRGDLLICVRDHGPGIPDELMEAALQPFRRAGSEASGAPLGAGIGLTIAQAQARTFGANLTLRNEVGGGLLATIRIVGAGQRIRPDGSRRSSALTDRIL